MKRTHTWPVAARTYRGDRWTRTPVGTHGDRERRCALGPMAAARGIGHNGDHMAGSAYGCDACEADCHCADERLGMACVACVLNTNQRIYGGTRKDASMRVRTELAAEVAAWRAWPVRSYLD